MNDKIKILKASIDMPSYPDWKKGIKWGSLWGVALASSIVLIEHIISMQSLKAHLLSGGDIFMTKIKIFSIAFIFTGLTTGILAAFRPKLKKRKNVSITVMAMFIFATVYTVSINLLGLLFPSDSPRQSEDYIYDTSKIAVSIALAILTATLYIFDKNRLRKH